jgi:hypothetical protein
MTDSKYYTDPKVKEEIDSILQNCSILFSNLGTCTTFDVKDVATAKKLESEWLEKIKDLDPIMYERLVPQKEVE